MPTENKYTPHVHAEVIKAWADGKPIEYLDDSGIWRRCFSPSWLEDYQYRVKPEEVVDYTVVFSNGCPGALFAITREQANITFGYLDKSLFQGYLKRTRIDGKVVSLEFISK